MTMKLTPNEIRRANAGWHFQFRFRRQCHWSGVAHLNRWALEAVPVFIRMTRFVPGHTSWGVCFQDPSGTKGMLPSQRVRRSTERRGAR